LKVTHMVKVIELSNLKNFHSNLLVLIKFLTRLIFSPTQLFYLQTFQNFIMCLMYFNLIN